MKKYGFLLILLLVACGKKETSIKKYYFPYAELTTPQVYKYTDKKNPGSVMYWYFKTDVKKGDTLLTTCIYDQHFNLTSVFLNDITPTGSSLKQMFVGLGDSLSMYQCMVKQRDAFNWIIKPGQKLYVAFGMQNEQNTESKEVITERSFEPKKELLNFNGKEYECILVKENTSINQVKTNRTVTEEQQRNSYYAEGIGLLQFETFNINGTSNIFALEKILTEAEWKQVNPASVMDSTAATAK